MKIYNASSLILTMKKALSETQVMTGTLLLNVVVEAAGLQGENISDATITRLVKRQNEVSEDIRGCAARPDIYEKAKVLVEKGIIPRVNQLLKYDTCKEILDTMKADKTVPDKMVNEIQKFYDNGEYADFFTTVILYALSRGNNQVVEETNQDDFQLMKEVGYKCVLCKGEKKLWRKSRKADKRIYLYKIIQIYPSNLEADLAAEFDEVQPPPRSFDSVTNKIALCRDCADAYVEEPNIEDYKVLIEKKQTSVRLGKAKDVADGSALESEITDVIKAISEIDYSTELKDFTDALTLSEKIDNNFLLESAIQENVVKYYSFIEKQFSYLDGGELGSHFRIISSEVTACYEKMEQAGLNQEEICAELANWILEKTMLGPSHQTAGNIVVAFFVQNCEVFSAHTE